MPSARLAPEAVLPYVTSGKAVLTLRSPTGARFTYQIRPAVRPKQNGEAVEWVEIPNRWRVALLTGPDNTRDYSKIGEVGTGTGWSFRPARGLSITPEAPSVKAVAFLFTALLRQENGAALPPALECWHEGRCGRCGRALTDPESIARGLGPDCAEKAGG